MSPVMKNNQDNDYIISSPVPDVVVPEMRLMDRIWKDTARFKNLVAVENAETKKSYTYQQLQKNVSIFATSLLKKFGLKPGDVVASVVPNCPEFPVVAFGTMHAGCIISNINPICKELDINNQLKNTEPKLVVTIPECYDTVLRGLKHAKNNSKIVVIDNSDVDVPDGAIRYSEIAESGEIDNYLLDKIEKKHEDVACIIFSSGTSGMPKGVEITYKNLLASIIAMQTDESCFSYVSDGHNQDIVPSFLPFSHIYGLVIGLLGHIPLGCKLITMSKFSASLYLDILKTQAVNLLYVVPPVAILLGRHPDVTADHFRNVRHFVCGAAPLSASDFQAILEKSKRDIEFNQGFATSETASLGTSILKKPKNVDYSTCGVPIANTKLRFADPVTGKPVPIGSQGEICIKSPTIMKGYHKHPAATRKAITEDGFFKTGDLGYYKPEVGLFHIDRIRDLINVNGMQVIPNELESLLRSHPAVQDAAVIGVPHEFYGEAPKALIIHKNGQKITEEEIQDYVASKVPVYKKIHKVAFVEEIPKMSSGKILRQQLKKMYT